MKKKKKQKIFTTNQSYSNSMIKNKFSCNKSNTHIKNDTIMDYL